MLQHGDPDFILISELNRKASEQKDTSPLLHQHVEDPLWLLFVIEDLTQVCRNNNLRISCEALKVASFVLENELARHKNPD